MLSWSPLLGQIWFTNCIKGTSGFVCCVPAQRAGLFDYAKLGWQRACVECQAWGRMGVFVCACLCMCVCLCACLYVYMWMHLDVCVCVSMPGEDEVHRTTSFGTHQFVTCEKRQSEDCNGAGHSSPVPHETPWHLSWLVTVRTCYSPPPASPLLSSTEDGGGGVKWWRSGVLSPSRCSSG